VNNSFQARLGTRLTVGPDTVVKFKLSVSETVPRNRVHISLGPSLARLGMSSESSCDDDPQLEASELDSPLTRSLSGSESDSDSESQSA
jgi:hypothetical protein